MQTVFLGKEQVLAYLDDLKMRLMSLGNAAPTVWVPLGYSGALLLEELFRVAPALSDQHPTIVATNSRRSPASERMEITWGQGKKTGIPRKKFVGKNVMVIDSAVHSGSTMLAVVQEIWKAGAAGVCSYSLVLKESSRFVPSYWAVTVADEDRAYFLLDSIPNNRFVRPWLGAETEEDEDDLANALVDRKPKRKPYFTVRRLSAADIGKRKFNSGVASLNRSAWPDLYFMMRTSSHYLTYVLEQAGAIVGYISLALPEEGELSIEQVAVARRVQGKGYASALLRWAETLARLKNCHHIRLWAIVEQQDKYVHIGFKHLDKEPLDLGKEEYVPMRKCLLAHTGCCSHST